ncbi:membrane hypothetical protein [Azospirillaceae bacterium]
MRKLLIVALVALIGLLPVTSFAQTQSQAPVAAKSSDGMYPLVVGLGAIAGVVGFNLAALGWGAIPMVGAYARGAVVPATASVAMSRVYATISAVTGALIANSLYSR